MGSREVQAYRAFVEEYVQEARRADYLTALDHELRPEALPAYDRVLAAPNGHVWAQIYEADLGAPHDWDVFDRERRFLGSVRVPASFYPMVISGDALVGVWRDALGVEHVRIYAVRQEDAD